MCDKTTTCSGTALICCFARHNSDKEIWICFICAVVVLNDCVKFETTEFTLFLLHPTMKNVSHAVSVNKQHQVYVITFYINHCRGILQCWSLFVYCIVMVMMKLTMKAKLQITSGHHFAHKFRFLAKLL